MRRGLVPGIVFLRSPGVPPVFSFGGRDVGVPYAGPRAFANAPKAKDGIRGPYSVLKKVPLTIG